jgi:hypothetical protein
MEKSCIEQWKIVNSIMLKWIISTLEYMNSRTLATRTANPANTWLQYIGFLQMTHPCGIYTRYEYILLVSALAIVM